MIYFDFFPQFFSIKRIIADIHYKIRSAVLSLQGWTALHVAVVQGYRDVVNILLENGCKNEKDVQGKTALHVAAGSLYVESSIIQTLLEHGCKPDELDSKEYEDFWQLGLPLEAKELDKKSANVFASLLKEEGYQHYEARVMLAGEQGTGKTTVARYLVGRGPTYMRKSTDGIDLYNGLSFIDRETEEWLHGKQEIAISRSLRQDEDISTHFKENWGKIMEVEEEQSEIAISRSLQQDLDTSTHFKENEKTFMEVQEEQSGDESFIISTDDPLPDQSDKMQQYSYHDKDVDQPFIDSRIVEEKASIESMPVLLEESTRKKIQRENIVNTPGEVLYEPKSDRLDQNRTQPVEPLILCKDTVQFLQEETCMETEVVRNPGIIKNLKKMFGVQKDVAEIKVSVTKENFLEESVKVGKKKLHQKKIAPVIIWDFGGQDVFYSTHQTFLTYRAIYLIVLDGSRTLDDPCPFEQYLPGKDGPKTARGNPYYKFHAKDQII
ncbi:Hypothetical predicted protein [Mytilus galloprovincialis]|uniref:Uncharacterized protein n=1 Tax=Mytilus galloprovincialis TaxID=29158 RepID=A0A8B6H8R1_MYTGA|nr:Hypothetical predicted protein [Mytilus galloprovincialis]